MSFEMLGLLAILLMFVLMFLRVPIAISMTLPGILGILYLRGPVALESAIESITWTQSFSYTFSTVPMFMLMGELLFISGISTDLFDTFRKWFGNFKGGLATSTIGASALFAAASGSSVASTGTMGVIAHKEMQRSGYSDKFSSGTIAAGGTLGILIPPSGAFIIYGILTEQSIGKLLIAGIIPGIVLTLLFIFTILITVKFQPQLAPDMNMKYSWKEKLVALKSTLWILVLFAIVIGGMYAGWFSPTEAAGVGAAVSVILAMAKRKLNLKSLITALERTLRSTGFLFAIIIGAFILNYFLALTGLPKYLASLITSLDVPWWVVMLLILAMYFVLGCVMDSLAMIVITMPIIVPIIQALGFDLIWFGVWIVVIIELALITPPVGMNCFVLKGAVPDLRLEDIFKGALRFVVPIIVMLVLLVLFPNMALWLPNHM
ncbi:TRAP transporter large permease [Neobacillus niacini]|uniref:TRAP transporter large permease n=1 Tax=Neobacillus niacini TaxID=86668 RepID=UPI0021CB1531|nr:TRAP transporter large permease [Neobacillus niacini]MCM3766160.1 TRAP transporter large permease [Neobacillus niacini]